jgi:hypothetical protein
MAARIANPRQQVRNFLDFKPCKGDLFVATAFKPGL